MALARFLLLVGGVLACYLSYGYVQELMFQAGMRPYGFYITLIQFVIYAIISKAHLILAGIKRSSLRLDTYAILSLLTVTTMACSNASLSHLSYPTQVVFKSCKLIPVMIGGILIQRKRFDLFEYLSAILLSFGLIIFTRGDVSVQPDYDYTGIVLICSALAADAAIGNVQERIMTVHKASNIEVIHYSYAIGSLMLLIFCAATGELAPAYTQFRQMDFFASYGLIAVFSVLGYVGLDLVLTLVRSYGALAAVTVTNLRKVVSIVISFLFFPKPFTWTYLLGGSVILVGIALQVLAKQK